MWLFNYPKNYPEMLKKIAWTMFFIVLIELFLFSHFWDSFSEFMSNISFNIKYEQNGLELYISYIYVPLIFALFENIFKLHDKISTLFKIRYRFDKHVIILSFLSKLNMMKKYKNIVKANRAEIMKNIFYKYAGYVNPTIDTHLIYMALGTWCWYWIFIDTMLVTFILGVIMLVCSFSWKGLLLFFTVLLFLYIISFLIKYFQCTNYAKQEVYSILDDKKRKLEIEKYLKDTL